MRWLFRKSRHRHNDVTPEDVFLDDHNLPAFDREHFEGRLEQQISGSVFAAAVILFLIVGGIFVYRLFNLQVSDGDVYTKLSQENRLRTAPIFAERGVIFDRSRTKLAWNTMSESGAPFAQRQYATTTGIAHLTGYLKYPSRDSSGIFYDTEYTGKRGVEKSFNDQLKGEHGKRIIEIDARNSIRSQSTVQMPVDGTNITTSVDAEVQHMLYRFIRERAEESGFLGGAGVLMDVSTGELLALTSYPEYDPQVLTNGDADSIEKIHKQSGNPFLNRVTNGQFIPGSIVKPFIGSIVLAEDIIEPTTNIISDGTLEVPNPYDPDKETVFYDWKAHGPVDMRDAISVSSNIYFYVVGGGYEDQEGLGIRRLAAGLKKFGFGSGTGINLQRDAAGRVPNQEWKEETFEDGTWRIGDTYNTAIGQFGFQVTPIQAVRATAALANNGHLITPKLRPREESQINQTNRIDIPASALQIVREGMRQAVATEEGTADAMDVSYLEVAAKTGTAEIGRASVNSWVIGYFPADEPRYAYAVVMERGPRDGSRGSVGVMRRLLDWMKQNKPAYVTQITNDN